MSHPVKELSGPDSSFHAEFLKLWTFAGGVPNGCEVQGQPSPQLLVSFGKQLGRLQSLLI